MFIGAEPHTAWLRRHVALDDRGFVLTGPRRRCNGRHVADGPGARRCCSRRACPGVFAVGDVRSGSIKRVASAVGEGSMAIRLVHEHLADAPGTPSRVAAQTYVSSK